MQPRSFPKNKKTIKIRDFFRKNCNNRLVNLIYIVRGKIEGVGEENGGMKNPLRMVSHSGSHRKLPKGGWEYNYHGRL